MRGQQEVRGAQAVVAPRARCRLPGLSRAGGGSACCLAHVRAGSPAGLAIRGDEGILDLTILAEQLLQVGDLRGGTAASAHDQRRACPTRRSRALRSTGMHKEHTPASPKQCCRRTAAACGQRQAWVSAARLKAQGAIAAPLRRRTILWRLPFTPTRPPCSGPTHLHRHGCRGGGAEATDPGRV